MKATAGELAMINRNVRIHAARAAARIAARAQVADQDVEKSPNEP